MRVMPFAFIAAFTLLVARVVVAAPPPAPSPDGAAERYRVHVLTMAPGEELFARFGHIAFVVDDLELETRVVYNFGTFNFDDPALALSYARGFLDYWLSLGSYSATVRLYSRHDRGLVRQTLNLTPAEAKRLVDRLDWLARPENRVYRYRHYLDNCCTRIRDLIDEVTDRAVSRGRDREPTGRTFRDWTDRALQGIPVSRWAILFSLGPAIDHPLTRRAEQFLPEVLSEDLDSTTRADGRPLVAERRVLHERRGPPIGSSPPPWELGLVIGVAALIGLGLLVPLIVGPRRGMKRLAGLGLAVAGFVLGFGGLGLTLFWTVTEHTDTHFNENLLAFPPTHFALFALGLRMLAGRPPGPRGQLWLGRYLLLCLGLIVVDLALKLGPFIQGNLPFVAFAAVTDLLMLGAAWRLGLARVR